MTYYKVTTNNRESCIVKTGSIVYEIDKWVDAPAVGYPLFVFNDLEAAIEFANKYLVQPHIYECDVDGIVSEHHEKVKLIQHTILAYRVKLIRLVYTTDISLKVGDIVETETGKRYLIGCLKDKKIPHLVFLGHPHGNYSFAGEEYIHGTPETLSSLSTLNDAVSQHNHKFKKIGTFNSIYGEKGN